MAFKIFLKINIYPIIDLTNSFAKISASKNNLGCTFRANLLIYGNA